MTLDDMVYVFDTSILVHAVRNTTLFQAIEQKLETKIHLHSAFISEVTVGEMLSLSLQLNWGKDKKQKMEDMLHGFSKVLISYTEIMEVYATIDAYSKNRHPEFSLPLGIPARKMGKNDLWIAATATVLDATLLTSDNDFGHLSPRFFQVENVGKWQV